MKKRLLLVGLMVFMLFTMISCTSGNQQGENDNSGNKPSTEHTTDQNNDNQENKDNTNSNNNEEVDNKNASKVFGIFYGTDGDKPDLLILDSAYHGKKLQLNDESRVFFSDKVMNTLVEAKVVESNGEIQVESAKEIEKIQLKGKYIGFSDGNFAEFQVGEKGFVVEVPQDLVEKLKETKGNELLSITIKQNETKQANPILVDFK